MCCHMYRKLDTLSFHGKNIKSAKLYYPILYKNMSLYYCIYNGR